MSNRAVRRIATLLSLAACLCAPRLAHAAVPEEMPPPEVKAAAKDSTRLLPNWVHLHAAAGLGWLASPEWMRKFYQAGQGYELGFEVRPAGAFRLRVNGEYQTLPAVTNASYSFVFFGGRNNDVPTRDSVLIQVTSTGWIGSARLEAQMALTPNLWLLGGVGRGYMETGLHSVLPPGEFADRLDFHFPGSSGWNWVGTAGVAYEFDVFGPRLSAEVRTSYMMRDDLSGANRLRTADGGRFQTWSIRLGWGGY
jgi:hypothetical protein